MLYEVRALRGNTLERLEIEASSSEDVMRLVTAQRLVFVEATPKRGSALPVRPSRFDLTLFSQELLELLDAGLAVVEAVDALATRKGPASALHSVLLSRLRQGFAFSAALEQLPEYFPAAMTLPESSTVTASHSSSAAVPICLAHSKVPSAP